MYEYVPLVDFQSTPSRYNKFIRHYVTMKNGYYSYYKVPFLNIYKYIYKCFSEVQFLYKVNDFGLSNSKTS